MERILAASARVQITHSENVMCWWNGPTLNEGKELLSQGRKGGLEKSARPGQLPPHRLVFHGEPSFGTVQGDVFIRDVDQQGSCGKQTLGWPP